MEVVYHVRVRAIVTKSTIWKELQLFGCRSVTSIFTMGCSCTDCTSSEWAFLFQSVSLAFTHPNLNWKLQFCSRQLTDLIAYSRSCQHEGIYFNKGDENSALLSELLRHKSKPEIYFSRCSEFNPEGVFLDFEPATDKTLQSIGYGRLESTIRCEQCIAYIMMPKFHRYENAYAAKPSMRELVVERIQKQGLSKSDTRAETGRSPVR